MQYKQLLVVSSLLAITGVGCNGSDAAEIATGDSSSELRTERGGSRDDSRQDWQSREGTQRWKRRDNSAGRAAQAGDGAGAAGSGGSTSAAGSSGSAGAAGRGGSTSAAGSSGSAGAADSGGVSGSPSTPIAGASGGTASGWWKPVPGSSWQWQLTGRLDTSVEATVYDIDLFDTSAAQIDALHAAGRKVICYFDTAYEPGRPDSSRLAPFRANPIDGWPGQTWVDVRERAVVEVMLERIALARSKGCDAVEADDIDIRSNDPGFALTAAEQRSFVTELANAAHAAGLGFGLKNALDDVPALVNVADFAINEECFEYDECDALRPFTAAGKAVLQVEYTDGSLDEKAAEICPNANARGFDTLIKHLDLDAARHACR